MLNQRVVCAALLNNENRIICSARHFDMLMHQQINNDSNPKSWKLAKQGFIDQFGKFLTREEALEIAKSQNQILRQCGGDEFELFSENLY